MRLALIARVVRYLLRAGNDPGTRLESLRQVARALVPDYRCTWPELDWWESESFNAYLDRVGEREGFNTQRRLMVAELLRLTAQIPGNTAECGVYHGSTSYLICAANARTTPIRRHHMFDSFAGVSAPTEEDGSHWKAGDLTTDIQVAEAALAEFPEKTFYPGWIPDRFDEVNDRMFSFVHLDVDMYQPTRDSIAFFYPRLSPGAVLLCDDYAFTTCPGATKACDEFLADKPEAMIRLSAGGGFLIKGNSTGPSSL